MWAEGRGVDRGGETVLHGDEAWARNCESETGQDEAGQGTQEELKGREGVGWERTSEECEMRGGGVETDAQQTGGSGEVVSRGRGGR